MTGGGYKYEYKYVTEAISLDGGGNINFPNNRRVISATALINSMTCPLIVMPQPNYSQAFYYIDYNSSNPIIKPLNGSGSSSFSVTYQYLEAVTE